MRRIVAPRTSGHRIGDTHRGMMRGYPPRCTILSEVLRDSWRFPFREQPVHGAHDISSHRWILPICSNYKMRYREETDPVFRSPQHRSDDRAVRSIAALRNHTTLTRGGKLSVTSPESQRPHSPAASPGDRSKTDTRPPPTHRFHQVYHDSVETCIGRQNSPWTVYFANQLGILDISPQGPSLTNGAPNRKRLSPSPCRAAGLIRFTPHKGVSHRHERLR